MSLGPRNKKEEAIFAQEKFRFEVQYLIQSSMNASGITRKELAKRLRVSQANVSQLLSDENNLTVRTIARIFHALGDEILIESKMVKDAKAKATTHFWVLSADGTRRACEKPAALPELAELTLARPQAPKWGSHQLTADAGDGQRSVA